MKHIAFALAAAFACAEKILRNFTISGQLFNACDGSSCSQTHLVSGSMHYFRHHPSTYADRLAKAKACGLNAVQTYVSWLRHEPVRGSVVRLDEDLGSFLRAAQAQGLLVILRPGPYICAEYDNGGLPGWLMANGTDSIAMRSLDPNFISALDGWYAVLLPFLIPYLYSNGGPVVMAQVDNEAGYWGTGPGHTAYLTHVRDLYEQYWGPGAVIIHSTDGWNQTLLANSHVPGVYQTVDFGPTDSPSTDIPAILQYQAQANGGPGQAPLMNSEYYVGGVNRNWGDGPYANDTQAAIDASVAFLSALLSYNNASVNLYMFSGGTNWGWEAGLHADGAAHWNVGAYVPGGPLTEAGDPSPYYEPVCAAISAHRGVPPPVVPPVSSKSHYSGTISATAYTPLWGAVPILSPAGAAGVSNFRAQSQEALGQVGGYTLYSTVTSVGVHADGSNLYIRQLRDRAYVYLNRTDRLGVYQRNMSDAWAIPPGTRGNGEATMQAAYPATLDVLVDNMGRDCFGGFLGLDTKGLTSGLNLGTWTNPYVWGWTAWPLPLDNVTSAQLSPVLRPIPSSGFNASSPTPVLYSFTLTIDKSTTPVLLDTFMDLRGWGKGAVVLNGVVLGRFWYLGPEYSLYVPAGLLRYGVNDIVVLETDGIGAGCAALGLRPGDIEPEGMLLEDSAQLVPSVPVVPGEVVPGQLDGPWGTAGEGQSSLPSLPTHAHALSRVTRRASASVPPTTPAADNTSSGMPHHWYGGCPVYRDPATGQSRVQLPLPSPGLANSRGSCSGSGAPTITFREVPVRDLPPGQ